MKAVTDMRQLTIIPFIILPPFQNIFELPWLSQNRCQHNFLYKNSPGAVNRALFSTDKVAFHLEYS